MLYKALGASLITDIINSITVNFNKKFNNFTQYVLLMCI